MIANNGQALIVTWDDAVDQFNNLIKFAAKQQVMNNSVDGMLSAEDLYQEGMIKLYDCWTKWCVGQNKDMSEFGPIFRKSLFRAMRKGSGKTRPNFVDIDDTAHTIKDENADNTIERLHTQEGLQLLMDSISPTARLLVQELMDPSERTLYEVWADIERKKMLKSQGHKVNVPKDNTIRMKHIIRSLGITGKQYDNAMIEIRTKANELLER